MIPLDVARCHGQDTVARPGIPLPMCRDCLRRTDVVFGREYWWMEPPAYVDPKPISEHDKAGTWKCNYRMVETK